MIKTINKLDLHDVTNKGCLVPAGIMTSFDVKRDALKRNVSKKHHQRDVIQPS